MTDSRPSDSSLVSLADLASMAGVSRPAVTNWRRRHDDFPAPVHEDSSGTLFKLAEIENWAAAHDKHLQKRSVDQHVWAALNMARSNGILEECVLLAMVAMGAAEAAERNGRDERDLLLEIAHLAPADRGTAAAFLLDQYAWEMPVRAEDLLPGTTRYGRIHSEALAQITNIAAEAGRRAVFEALLAALTRSSSGAGIATDRGVARLMVRLARPRGAVCDPACGTGTLLLSAAEAAAFEGMAISGSDINIRMVAVARLRLFVHGLDADVQAVDSFEGADARRQSADTVLSNPPWGARLPDRSLDQQWALGRLPGSRADLAWVQLAVHLLRPDGVAALCLAPGVLFRSGAEADIRRRLVVGGCVRAVISLPPGAASVHKGIAPVVLLLRPLARSNSTPPVIMIDASSAMGDDNARVSLNDEAIAGIVAAFEAFDKDAAAPDSCRFPTAAVPVSQLLNDEQCNLAPSRWIQHPGQVADSAAQLTSYLASLGEASRALRLDDLAVGIAQIEPDFARQPRAGALPGFALPDIAAILRPPRVDRALLGTGDTPVVRAMDLTDASLRVAPGSTIDLNLADRDFELTRPGDILVRTHGERFAAAVDEDGGNLVDHPVEVIRLHGDMVTPVFLAAFITHCALEHVVSMAGLKTLRLREVRVPVPDLEVQTRVSALLIAIGDQRANLKRALESMEGLSSALVRRAASTGAADAAHSHVSGGSR